jgi:hypothetical protein
LDLYEREYGDIMRNDGGVAEATRIDTNVSISIPTTRFVAMGTH